MPNLPIIDTHLHLWDPQNLEYAWLNNIPLLNKTYLLNDYKEATAALEIEKMVFLQCECSFDQCEQEVAWVTELSREESRIEGIVAWAPLELGEGARSVLERYSQNRLVKGIRRIIQFEPDMEFCLQPDFVKGVGLLAEFDMSFDICISHIHFKNTIKLVRQCPKVRFILDHIGKPDIKNSDIDEWKRDLAKLASFDNVHCKMSGLVTEADTRAWKKEDLKPYIDHVIESFGVDRVMFGGDWPVVLQAAEYARWVETLDWALAGMSEADLRKIYRDNAARFYKLS